MKAKNNQRNKTGEDVLIIEAKDLKEGELPVNKIIHGNALEVLKKLPSNSIDCVITSPPYWAKRDYGEETCVIWGGDPNCKHEWGEEIIVKMRGSLASNIESRKGIIPGQGEYQSRGRFCKKCGAWLGQLGLEPDPFMFVDHLIEIFKEVKRVLKPTGNLFVVIDDTYLYGWPATGTAKDKRKIAPRKSLCLVPELFAIRMVYDLGFILRNKIVWAKKVYIYQERRSIGNAKPESVKDRLMHVWEYVFHFVKEPKYWYNLDKIKTKKGTNPGDVIQINVEPHIQNHFAVFPTKLVEFLLEAGCPENGTVLDPFLGSGTTAIVALEKGRKFIGIELNREYCKLALKRIKSTLKQRKLVVC